MPYVDAQHSYEQTSVAGPAAPRPKAIVSFYTKVVQGTKSFMWNCFRMVDNWASEGDQCAGYGKMYKHAKGQSWVDCREGQDLYEGPGTEDSGPLFVDELDFMGARGRKTRGAMQLWVIGRSSLVPWRDPADRGVAHLPYLAYIVPYTPDWGFVKFDGAIHSTIKSERGLISMQGGDCIRMSQDDNVGVWCFEPATGITGLWLRERKFCIVGWNNTTGQEYKMQEFPQATF